MKYLSWTALAALSLALAAAPGLPDAVDGYTDWTRLNTERVTENPSGAHPQSKDIYISVDPTDFTDGEGGFATALPDGTRLVKERNDTERLLVDRVYLMEKLDGQWNYSFYDRQADGSFSGEALGAENFCQACHQGAAATDFVYTRYERR